MHTEYVLAFVKKKKKKKSVTENRQRDCYRLNPEINSQNIAIAYILQNINLSIAYMNAKYFLKLKELHQSST